MPNKVRSPGIVNKLHLNAPVQILQIVSRTASRSAFVVREVKLLHQQTDMRHYRPDVVVARFL